MEAKYLSRTMDKRAQVREQIVLCAFQHTMGLIYY